MVWLDIVIFKVLAERGWWMLTVVGFQVSDARGGTWWNSDLWNDAGRISLLSMSEREIYLFFACCKSKIYRFFIGSLKTGAVFSGYV